MQANGLSRRSFLKGSAATLAASYTFRGDQMPQGFARLPESVQRQRFNSNPLSRGVSTTWATSKDSTHTPYLVVNTRMCPPRSNPQNRVSGTITVLNRDTEEIVGFQEIQADGLDDYRVRATFTLDPKQHYTVRAQANELSAQSFSAYTHSPQIRPLGSNEFGDRNFVRLTVASCMQFSTGFWNAYSFAAKRNPDAFFLIGDSIYADVEDTIFTSGRPRKENVPSASERKMFLSKYLVCYDKHLQHLRRNTPVYGVPDDHEMKNNIEGSNAVSDAVVVDGCEAYSLAYASPDGVKADGFYRRVDFGQGTRVLLLDTRRFRDSSNATMLGSTQLQWLKGELAKANSDSVTRLLIVSSVSFTSGLERLKDSWSGYARERQHVIDEVAKYNLPVSFVSGDLHTFFTGAVHLDPFNTDTDIVGYEFEGGAVSSRVGPTHSVNPSVQAFSKQSHGFMEFDCYDDGTLISRWFLYDAERKDYVPVESARFHAPVNPLYGPPPLTFQKVDPELVANPGEIALMR